MTVPLDAYVHGSGGSQIKAGRGIAIGVEEPPGGGGGGVLTWAPPDTTGYTTWNVPATGNKTQNLDVNTDYIVEMPATPRTDPILFIGGRNIVIIGGEIRIDDIVHNANGGANEGDQEGMRFVEATGTTSGRIVHVEGVLMHGYGLSDGIRTGSNSGTPPGACDMRVQNCRIELGMWYRDFNLDSTGSPHPDILQPFGGVDHLRVDKLTGLITGQGLMLKPDFSFVNSGYMELKRLNLRENTNPNIEYNDAGATWPNPGRDPRFLWWTNGNEGGVRVEKGTVWFNHPTRTFLSGSEVFWPEGAPGGTDATGTYKNPDHSTGWDGTGSGFVYEGNPPSGDYSPSGTPGEGIPGIGYTTPGYA